MLSSDTPRESVTVESINVEPTNDPFLGIGVGRVRYSRFDTKNGHVPKNALYTLTLENIIYFGISRCNLKADTPIKSVGRHIALQRAVEAFTRHKHNKSLVSIDPDGVTGRCTPEFFPYVEEFFYNLDRSGYEDF